MTGNHGFHAAGAPPAGRVGSAFDGGGQRREIDALGIHDTHPGCVLRGDTAKVADHDGGAAGRIVRRGDRVLPA